MVPKWVGDNKNDKRLYRRMHKQGFKPWRIRQAIQEAKAKKKLREAVRELLREKHSPEAIEANFGKDALRGTRRRKPKSGESS